MGLEAEDPVDGVLAPFLTEWRAREDVLGAILTGSRAAGCADERSDYDVALVLTDAACDALLAAKPHVPGDLVDVSPTSPRRLKELAARPTWATPGFVGARVLLDKTGEVAALLEAVVRLDPGKARADAAGWLDAYLNGFVRSLKAARRGNWFGAHLEAAESVQHLIKALFYAHGRWPPYHDRLRARLGQLSRAPWSPEELEGWLQHILATADPAAQQRLEAEVEAFMRADGYGHVFDSWGKSLESAKRHRFAQADA